MSGLRVTATKPGNSARERESLRRPLERGLLTGLEIDPAVSFLTLVRQQERDIHEVLVRLA